MPYLKIRTPEVVHETVDDEVVIINLDKGIYYSTDGVGACIWSQVAEGLDREAIVRWGADNFADVGSAEADVRAFLAELEANELVTETSEPAPAVTTAEQPTPVAYRRPELQVFTDMEDLLLLDPIHDVEAEQGWPTPAG